MNNPNNIPPKGNIPPNGMQEPKAQKRPQYNTPPPNYRPDYDPDEYDDEEEDEDDGGNKKWLLLLLLLLLIAAVGTAGFFGMKYFKGGKSNSGDNVKTEVTDGNNNGDRGIVDKDGALVDGGLPFDDPEKLREELQKKVDESMLAIKINTNPVFQGQGSKGNLSIENSENNNYDFQVEITLESDGSTIYTTPLMSPGQHILEDVLDAELPEGDHKAMAMFYAYDSNKELVGQAGASIIITMKSEK